MKLTLNRKLSQLIEHQISSGRFSTAEEVIAAGVTRVLAEFDLSTDVLADIRTDVQIGLQQADRKEFVQFTAKEIIAEGTAILAKKKPKKKP